MVSLKGLKKSFELNEATVGVIGLGYVGIPLSIKFSEIGYKVIGFDSNKSKISSLKKSKSYLSHIDSKSISSAIKKGFEVTNNFSEISKCDAIIICVPTPLDENKNPNLEYIKSSLDSAGPYLKKYQAISLESTTYPGTCEELILPYLKNKNFSVGKDFFLIYSPEREDPGNKNFSINNIPKIVAGHTQNCLDVGLALYGTAVSTLIPVKDTKVGEMAKLLENAHRAVNIAFINEMKVVAEKMKIDIFDVIDAAKSKPFGFSPYFPGPGIGGHCIPIDPLYLSWKAKQFNASTKIIDLADEINSAMPKRVVDKTSQALKENFKKMEESKILILGIAYKKNIDDIRESPALKIAEELNRRGSKVYFSDPFVKSLEEKIFELPKSINLTIEEIKEFDVAIICTDHDSFDYDFISSNLKIIIDSRGRISKNKNVYRA